MNSAERFAESQPPPRRRPRTTRQDRDGSRPSTRSACRPAHVQAVPVARAHIWVEPGSDSYLSVPDACPLAPRRRRRWCGCTPDGSDPCLPGATFVSGTRSRRTARRHGSNPTGQLDGRSTVSVRGVRHCPLLLSSTMEPVQLKTGATGDCAPASLPTPALTTTTAVSAAATTPSVRRAARPMPTRASGGRWSKGAHVHRTPSQRRLQEAGRQRPPVAVGLRRPAGLRARRHGPWIGALSIGQR